MNHNLYRLRIIILLNKLNFKKNKSRFKRILLLSLILRVKKIRRYTVKKIPIKKLWNKLEIIKKNSQILLIKDKITIKVKSHLIKRKSVISSNGKPKNLQKD